MPKSLGGSQIPLPKWNCQSRLAIVREEVGLSLLIIHFASANLFPEVGELLAGYEICGAIEVRTAGKPGSIPPKPEEKKKPVKKEEPGKEAEPIEAKLEAEILRLVSELSRQRNTNRVRAEAALKRIGPAALPYLEKVARHPFALTRRAVVRIAAAAPGEAADQLLQAALQDKDEWVRKLSRQALAKRGS